MGNNAMKDDYDFSKAERGKFHRPGVKLNLPVYLDDEVQQFIQNIADSKDSDLSTVVNDLLRVDMKLAEALKS